MNKALLTGVAKDAGFRVLYVLGLLAIPLILMGLS